MYPAFPDEQDIFIKYLTDTKDRLTFDELDVVFSMYFSDVRTKELIDYLRTNFPEKYRELCAKVESIRA